MTNIFLKTSDGQLFPEISKDIFLVAYLFMFSGISSTATHFAVTVKENITGNKLHVLKLPCELKETFLSCELRNLKKFSEKMFQRMPRDSFDNCFNDLLMLRRINGKFQVEGFHL